MSAFLYWPLGEPEGSTTAGNIAPGRSEVLTVTQVGTGGTLSFGTGIGPRTDDLTAPTFTPVNTSNGKYLACRTDVMTSGDHVLEMEAWFISTGPGAVSETIVVLRAEAAPVPLVGGMRLALDPSGEPTLELVNGVAGTISITPAGTTSLRDGALHHVVGRAVLVDSGSVDLDLIVDGVKTSSSLVWPWVSGGVAFFPGWPRLGVGGARLGLADGDCFTGTIAHVALRAGVTATPDARFAEHYEAGTTGFAGESSGARIERYARYAGIPTAEIAAETGLTTSMAHLDITGKSPLEAMQEVATTEDGVLFDAGDGTLTFHARSHRYNSTSAFTLSRSAGDIEEGFTPTLDDQNLTNDMTASRPGGITVRSVNQPSIDEYGYYRESVEILTTSDNEVQSRADWQVNRFGTPRVTVPNVETDLLSASATVQAALLAADIGTRFTLSNLPGQAPASTQDYFIEGITYTIGPTSFKVAFNVSPADYADVWTLGSASFSQLDSTTVLAY